MLKSWARIGVGQCPRATKPAVKIMAKEAAMSTRVGRFMGRNLLFFNQGLC